MNKDIVDYYNKVKDKYPDVSLKQFGDICNSPFRLAKSVMSDNYKDIRLQYFGVFRVSPFRVKRVKEKIKKNLEDKIITQDKYDVLLNRLEEYEKTKD